MQELPINICRGCVIGFVRHVRYTETEFIIGRVVEQKSNYSITYEYQGSNGLERITSYYYDENKEFFFLSLKEELLSLEGFKCSDGVWISPNEQIHISKNTGKSKKEWNLKVFDEDGNLDLFVNFNYIHELQFFCIANQTELGIKFGNIRIVYQNDLKPE
jgi:hypothetical protein